MVIRIQFGFFTNDSFGALISFYLSAMGKSPAKWVKTVLCGKKSSKSNISKDATIDRKTNVATKAISGDLAVHSPPISDPIPQIASRSGGVTELEKGLTADEPRDAGLLLPGEQDADTIVTTMSSSVNYAEIARQEQASTTVQAAFRGYLARRAFWALKGIIRLQGLVRGYLVRRQACATLRCMQAIIKFQALVRGRRVRLCGVRHAMHKQCRTKHSLVVKWVDSLRSERLATNLFVCKLLASSPTAVPLNLQYDLVEPNSVYNWLDRWSSSRFWEPPARSKKVRDAKPQRKQANMHTEETEAGRRKVPIINSDNSVSHSSENEKPKRNLKKVSSHYTEPVQEQSQHELERVKHNLRKVSASATVASDVSEAVVGKPQNDQIKMLSSPTPDVSEQGMTSTSEKISESTVVAEAPPQPLAGDELLDLLHEEQPHVELHSPEYSEKVENHPSADEKLCSNEDQTCKENQRHRRRSLPAKQEFPENVSQNTLSIPSYMAATESAKAKLKAQGSPRFSEDKAENGFIRRHSLPSSTNAKLSSSSPRMQKPIQANGKGGSRNNKPLTSSRDEKVLEPGCSSIRSSHAKLL